MFKANPFRFTETSDNSTGGIKAVIPVLALSLSLGAHLFLLTFKGTPSAIHLATDTGERIIVTELTSDVSDKKSNTVTGNAKHTQAQPFPNKRDVKSIQKVEQFNEPAFAAPVSLLEFWGPEQPYYFTPKQLSEGPIALQDGALNLDFLLHGNGSQSAQLRLQINENGGIDQVLIDRSDFSKAEQNLLINAFSRMKFRPARIADIQVKSELRIEVVAEKPAPPPEILLNTGGK